MDSTFYSIPLQDLWYLTMYVSLSWLFLRSWSYWSWFQHVPQPCRRCLWLWWRQRYEIWRVSQHCLDWNLVWIHRHYLCFVETTGEGGGWEGALPSQSIIRSARVWILLWTFLFVGLWTGFEWIMYWTHQMTHVCFFTTEPWTFNSNFQACTCTRLLSCIQVLLPIVILLSLLQWCTRRPDSNMYWKNLFFLLFKMVSISLLQSAALYKLWPLDMM